MFANSLDKKPLFKRPDGIIVRDLSSTMFNLKNKNYVSYSVFRVPRDYVMRPDLISQVVYNNSAYAEIILKYNGISNPFIINENDMILIPNLESAEANINKRNKTGTGSGADAIRNSYKYIDPAKIPKKGKELQNFDDRQIGTDTGQLDATAAAAALGTGGIGGTGAGTGGLGGGINGGVGGQVGGGTGVGGIGTTLGIGIGTGGQIGTGGLTAGQQVNVGNGALPPNIAAEGSSQITYRSGRVYFGDSVATCLKSGSSTSEFLSSIIKSKGQQ